MKQHKAAKAKKATEKLKHPEEEKHQEGNKEPAKSSNLDDDSGVPAMNELSADIQENEGLPPVEPLVQGQPIQPKIYTPEAILEMRDSAQQDDPVLGDSSFKPSDSVLPFAQRAAASTQRKVGRQQKWQDGKEDGQYRSQKQSATYNENRKKKRAKDSQKKKAAESPGEFTPSQKGRDQHIHWDFPTQAGSSYQYSNATEGKHQSIDHRGVDLIEEFKAQEARKNQRAAAGNLLSDISNSGLQILL